MNLRWLAVQHTFGREGGDICQVRSGGSRRDRIGTFWSTSGEKGHVSDQVRRHVNAPNSELLHYSQAFHTSKVRPSTVNPEWGCMCEHKWQNPPLRDLSGILLPSRPACYTLHPGAAPLLKKTEYLQYVWTRLMRLIFCCVLHEWRATPNHLRSSISGLQPEFMCERPISRNWFLRQTNKKWFVEQVHVEGYIYHENLNQAIWLVPILYNVYTHSYDAHSIYRVPYHSTPNLNCCLFIYERQ